MVWTVHIPYLHRMLIIAIVECELVIFNYNLFWSAFSLKFSGILVICSVYTVTYLIFQLDDWYICASFVCTYVCMIMPYSKLQWLLFCVNYSILFTCFSSLLSPPRSKGLFWLCKNLHHFFVKLCILSITIAFLWEEEAVCHKTANHCGRNVI